MQRVNYSESFNSEKSLTQAQPFDRGNQNKLQETDLEGA